MKELSIEDGKVLMIGDLVVGCIETDIVGEATYKILCKVTDINHYGDVSCEALKSFPDELDWQDGDDFSWIEAVPLTTEILEKNGFDTSDPEVKQYHFTEDGQSYHFSLRQMYNQKDNKPNGYSFYAFSVLTIIKYVHQLQHALRLCGIEKEIVL